MLKDIANVEQAQSWDGADGDHWTEHEDTYNRAVERHHAAFMQTAAVQPEDRVLDIGCGTGRTTRDAARAAVRGHALGVDLSSRQLERARERAGEEGIANVRFEQADAQVYPFERGAFDIAMSRFGSMFFADHVAAFRNIREAVRPDGRLVLMSWQELEQQDWLMKVRTAFAAGRDLPGETPGKPGPFGLAERAYIERVLSDAGYTDIAVTPVSAKMWFGATADAAYEFWMNSGLARGLLGNAPDDVRQRATTALRELLAAHETPEGVLLDSAAWLTTARRA